MFVQYWMARTGASTSRVVEWTCPSCRFNGFATIVAYARGTASLRVRENNREDAELAAYQDAANKAEAQLRAHVALLTCPKCGARRLSGRLLLGATMLVGLAFLFFPIVNAWVFKIGDGFFQSILGAISVVFGLYFILRAVLDPRVVRRTTTWFGEEGNSGPGTQSTPA